ncbi:MAG: TlyA family RNA methyltransferase [Myxococcota bacterium]|nr:TlyA family RNA methyltransferase [Myxococcota bacterium]
MARSDKERLDVLLVERGLVESRTRAQALILAGRVVVNEHRRDKPGERIPADATITVKQGDEWASRGAHKLLGALESFPLLKPRIQGARCLDIGASTGGFTDVLLKHGAAEVIALDVGYGQLHWRLQSDPRVTLMDRTNVRHLAPDRLPWAPDVITCDTSFISVRLFVDVMYRELSPGGVAVVLVKPQFEVGRDRVGRGGVVRDEEARRDALDGVRHDAQALGFSVLGAIDSPLPGPQGNRVWLLVMDKTLKETPQITPGSV